MGSAGFEQAQSAIEQTSIETVRTGCCDATSEARSIRGWLDGVNRETRSRRNPSLATSRIAARQPLLGLRGSAALRFVDRCRRFRILGTHGLGSGGQALTARLSYGGFDDARCNRLGSIRRRLVDGCRLERRLIEEHRDQKARADQNGTDEDPSIHTSKPLAVIARRARLTLVRNTSGRRPPPDMYLWTTPSAEASVTDCLQTRQASRQSRRGQDGVPDGYGPPDTGFRSNNRGCDRCGRRDGKSPSAVRFGTGANRRGPHGRGAVHVEMVH